MNDKSSVRVLVVDDDSSMADLVTEVLARKGFLAQRAVGGAEAIAAAKAQAPDVVVSDVRMEPISGLEVLRAVRALHPETIFILMTAFGTLESAIEAVRDGAYDYVSKPFKIEELLLVIDRALESRRIAHENTQLRGALGESPEGNDLIGRSPQMVEVFKAIARAAATSAAVLVQGETGSGKEVVARAIHRHGPRKSRHFLAINCAALPENLLESELFGHEKGAFTGAVTPKKGLFREADGGTVLLDEIGDMPLALQTKILRTLQSGEVRPVGGVEAVVVDVRVIAATNQNLRVAVQEATFREDLFFRLNTVMIRVPPLREHLEDLPLLVQKFLRGANTRNNKGVTGISNDAHQLLAAYDWPGNVRELEHVIERAVAFSRQGVIVPEDLPREMSEPRQSHLMSLDEMEKRHILHVLKRSHGNRQRAAEVLGIDRKTLYRKLLKFGLDASEDGPI